MLAFAAIASHIRNTPRGNLGEAGNALAEYRVDGTVLSDNRTYQKRATRGSSRAAGWVTSRESVPSPLAAGFTATARGPEPNA